jgi:hypothetical protein
MASFIKNVAKVSGKMKRRGFKVVPNRKRPGKIIREMRDLI